jgi:ribosome-associated protein
MLAPETLAELRLAARAASDRKAFHLVGLEVGDLTSYTDSLLICSAASERQVGAIVKAVSETLRANGRRPLHVEGAPRSDWVLIDYGDLVVHVFTEEKRAYYALDSLWGDAPRLEAESLGIARRGGAGAE